MADRRLHDALLPAALALLDHLHDDPQGNRKLEMDSRVLPSSHRYRAAALLHGGDSRPTAGMRSLRYKAVTHS